MQKQVTSWAKRELINYCFLHSRAEGDDKTVHHSIFYIIYNLLLNVYKKWHGLFHNGAIIGTFSAHLTATQGEKTVLELEVEGV